MTRRSHDTGHADLFLIRHSYSDLLPEDRGGSGCSIWPTDHNRKRSGRRDHLLRTGLGHSDQFAAFGVKNKKKYKTAGMGKGNHTGGFYFVIGIRWSL